MELRKSVQKNADPKVLEYFYRQRLCKRTVLCLEDQVEKNREMAIEIMSTMVGYCGFKEESAIILPAIAARMNKNPFPEPCKYDDVLTFLAEEVRCQLIEFLDVCMDADDGQAVQQFVHHLPVLCGMLGRAATDPNPDMKIKTARFAGRLSAALGKTVGPYFKSTVDGLVGNLSHQHSKVRKQTLIGLKDVLGCKGAEPFFEGATMEQLKFTMNDRSNDVRAQFYEVLFHWMQVVEINYLRAYEPNFLQFLLNGIGEKEHNVGPKCIKFIEEHGNRMKEALIALGEEKEDASMEASSQQKDDDALELS
jgi:hypothetical protein